MKTKLLAWSDYCAPTGFSNVMSNILRRLSPKDFDIDVLAINYRGDPDFDRKRFPGKIYPAIKANIRPYDDQLGRQQLIDLVVKNDYNVVFILQDTFNVYEVMPLLLEVKKKMNKEFKIVYYFPIDSPPWVKWIKNSVSLADVPVAYTQYGANCVSMADPEIKPLVIPHGIDLKDFFLLHDRENVNQYRQWHFPGSVGKFLLLNVNRNQPRKDIPRSLLVLHELKKSRDDIALFLHMSNADIGGDLTPIANQLGLVQDVDYFMPKDLSHDGVPVNILNLIYNMSDAVMTTTLGEGWGLSLTEAMATRTPVIAPDIPPISEILANWRGTLAKAGSNSSLWTVINNDNMVLRPLTDVEDMASKILRILEEKNWETSDQTYEWVETLEAYDWVTTLDWNIIVEQHWRELLSA